MIKYVIFPGEVKSQYDGEIHYITASQLINLYHINPNECIIVDFDRPEAHQGIDFDSFIPLEPRANGDYSI